jgi:hypothetical protein
MFAAIPGAVAVVQSTAGAVKSVGSLFGGGGGKDLFKDKVWSQVPFATRRIQGGKGKWKDPLTGESGNDNWGNVRGVAVVAPAINAYVDANGVLHDADTSQPISREDAWARWVARFGDVGFTSAFFANPSSFQPYTNDSSADPIIGAAAPKQPNAGEQLRDYVKDQAQDVVDAAKQAGSNIAGVATGAVAGAQAGAQSTIATQNALQGNTMLYVLLGAAALIAVVVLTRKRSA